MPNCDMRFLCFVLLCMHQCKINFTRTHEALRIKLVHCQNDPIFISTFTPAFITSNTGPKFVLRLPPPPRPHPHTIRDVTPYLRPRSCRKILLALLDIIRLHSLAITSGVHRPLPSIVQNQPKTNRMHIFLLLEK